MNDCCNKEPTATTDTPADAPADHTDLAKAFAELTTLKTKILQLSKCAAQMTVQEYPFKTWDGQTKTLSQLFGDRNELIVVHNMGVSCPYCTLWADGFNGIVHHLNDRAPFVVISPDAPETQQAFATERGWKFTMLSAQENTFAKDMGYEDEQGNPHPGISTFKRNPDGNIHRTATSPFGPGDNFCPAWHIFDLLEDGPNNWQPKFNY